MGSVQEPHQTDQAGEIDKYHAPEVPLLVLPVGLAAPDPCASPQNKNDTPVGQGSGQEQLGTGNQGGKGFQHQNGHHFIRTTPVPEQEKAKKFRCNQKNKKSQIEEFNLLRVLRKESSSMRTGND